VQIAVFAPRGFHNSGCGRSAGTRSYRTRPPPDARSTGLRGRSTVLVPNSQNPRGQTWRLAASHGIAVTQLCHQGKAGIDPAIGLSAARLWIHSFARRATFWRAPHNPTFRIKQIDFGTPCAAL